MTAISSMNDQQGYSSLCTYVSVDGQLQIMNFAKALSIHLPGSLLFSSTVMQSCMPVHDSALKMMHMPVFLHLYLFHGCTRKANLWWTAVALVYIVFSCCIGVSTLQLFDDCVIACDVFLTYCYQQFVVCDLANFRGVLGYIVCLAIPLPCCCVGLVTCQAFTCECHWSQHCTVGASFHGNCNMSLTCRRPSLDLNPALLFPNITVPFHCRMPWLHFFIFLALSYRFWYVLFHVHSHFNHFSFLKQLTYLCSWWQEFSHVVHYS